MNFLPSPHSSSHIYLRTHIPVFFLKMSERERKTRKATAKSNLNLLQHFSAAAAAYKDLDKNRKRERWRRKKNFCVYLVLMSYLRRLLWAVFVTTNIDEIQRFLGTKKMLASFSDRMLLA